MFNLNEILVHKETNKKVVVDFMGVGGHNYCLKDEDNNRFHIDGIDAEKLFRLATVEEKKSFRGKSHE